MHWPCISGQYLTIHVVRYVPQLYQPITKKMLTLCGWDWALSPGRQAGTGPGLGTECSVERWDWGLSARPVAMIPEKKSRFDPSI
jgi:hypothetical protein